ncbi:MAG: ABC transporter substrate-binding protein [Thermincolia bacterium]
MKKHNLSKLIVSLMLILAVGLAGCAKTKETPQAEKTPEVAPAAKEIVFATTTSTQDSGLLDVLLPVFEKNSGVKVKVLAQGTGQAIKTAEQGNADVLLVHSRKAEDEFMTKGFGENAWDVMYNQFFIVGPANDPAKIKDSKTAVDAFKKIAAAKATFISRGDDSGTHKKELSIWEKAGIEPEGTWYVSVGQGMGATLKMAEEKNAYTLVDEATFLTNKAKLEILVQGEKTLLNPYGVIKVKSTKQSEAADSFISFITGAEGQKLIGDFGKDKYGKSIFVPQAKKR